MRTLPQPSDMDTTPDDPNLADIYILRCPFCANRFVIPHVYRTHLLAHIHSHCRGNRFQCRMCPKEHRDITCLVNHIERRHSKRMRQHSNSPLFQQIERDNLTEKERQIAQLSTSEDPSFLPKLPY